jgi:hypothetical protein
VAAASASSCGHGFSGLTWSGVSGLTPPDVVDAGAQQRRDVVERDEVGRRLHPRLRAHHQPGDGDGGQVLLALGVRHAAHGGVVLGDEVLDDHLLHVAVPAVRARIAKTVSARSRSVSPMPTRQPGGEGHRLPPGVLEHLQPHRRVLVRRPCVGGHVGGRLEHHPHRGGHRLEPLQLAPGQHARVEVRQQPVSSSTATAQARR